MHVAVAKLTLRLPENQDLKGKRRTVKSLCARIRNKFDVAIAEVADNDLRQTATLGIAAVSNSPRHASRTIDTVLDHIERTPADYEVVDIQTETLSGF